MRLILCIATAFFLASGAASAQTRTTELQARSYIQSAFITGVAQAILADDVALGPQLRERLALPADAKRDQIYQAIFALTVDRSLHMSASSAHDARGRPVFTLEGGAVPLVMVYDLDSNTVPYVGVPGARAAADATAPAEPEPTAVRVANARTSTFPANDSAPETIRLKPIAFAFDDAALGSDAKTELEREGLPKMVEIHGVRYVVHGHSDRLGSPAHNQLLSEQRAQAVRDYLVERGVPAQYIDVAGLGASMSLTKCETKSRHALIECLAPDRRVTVEIRPPAAVSHRSE